ncbi:UNVERIFIED_CONTAM: hypothetical protein Sindi_0172500, partial [Sesamum indicum]
TVSLPTNSLLEPPSPSTASGSPKKPPSFPPPNSSQTKVSASGLKELNGISNDVGVSSLGTPRGSNGIHATSEATNNDSLSTGLFGRTISGISASLLTRSRSAMQSFK